MFLHFSQGFAFEIIIVCLGFLPVQSMYFPCAVIFFRKMCSKVLIHYAADAHEMVKKHLLSI